MITNDRILAIEQITLEHHGVKGMKWGQRRFAKRILRSQKKADKADVRQQLSNKIEGTHGSQLRRMISRPVQASANRLGQQSDREAQVAYLKTSRKLTKLRARTTDQSQIAKLKEVHSKLQTELSKQQEIRKKTAGHISEQQMRQLNDIYGGFSKGAKLSTALGGLDESTKQRIKSLSTAVDIATAAVPIGKASRTVTALKPKADALLKAANNVAEGKSPIKPIDKKELAIKAAKFTTNRDGYRTEALNKVKKSKKTASK